VSLTTDPARATVDIGYSQRTKIDDFALIETRLLRLGVNVTQSGSAALGLARVADGRLDGYAERHLYAWGALAGLLLVEEAGGRVNAFLTRVSGVLGLGMTLTVAPRPACTNWSWMTRLASPSSVTGPPPGKLSRSHRQRAEEGECVAKQRADRDRSPDPRTRR